MGHSTHTCVKRFLPSFMRSYTDRTHRDSFTHDGSKKVIVGKAVLSQQVFFYYGALGLNVPKTLIISPQFGKSQPNKNVQ